MSDQETTRRWRSIKSAPLGVIEVKTDDWAMLAYRGADGRYYHDDTGEPLYVQPTKWRRAT